MTKISYKPTHEAWQEFSNFLLQMIRIYQVHQICEIGGGANPLLEIDFIASNNLDYSIIDISATELAKASSRYRKIQADIASLDFQISEKYDFVFSKMLAEHIKDAEQFHKNVFSMLKTKGIAIHFFPTFFTIPFLVNFLFPERITSFLLDILSPRNPHMDAKFPAYYHWCRGPLTSQIQKFQKIGFKVVEYDGFFGHHGYYKRLPFLQKLHAYKTNFLLKNPSPLFTSYAYLVLQKP